MLRNSALFTLITAVCSMAATGATAGEGFYYEKTGRGLFADYVKVYSLFEGRQDDLSGFTTLGGGDIPEAWEVVDGTIHLDRQKGGGGYLVTKREFGDFDLRFQWKISEGGNSGVKYRVKKFDKGGWLGCEYQILDDANHPNGKVDDTTAGALYDVYAPNEACKYVRPVGEWNHSRIVVRGNSIQHWLNGRLILSVCAGSSDWQAHIQDSKFRDVEGFGRNRVGRIMFQDHGNEVWYRSITVRPLSGHDRDVTQPEAPACVPAEPCCPQFGRGGLLRRLWRCR